MNDLYIEMCRKSSVQKKWKPKSGDIFRREYTVFGEKIDKKIWKKDQLHGFEILVRPTSVDGYWVATNKEGASITLTDKDLYKKACIWLPRQEDWQEMLDHLCLPTAVYKVEKDTSLINEELLKRVMLTGKFINKNYWDQLWCVFYHKKVLGLIWDFNKEKWIKQK